MSTAHSTTAKPFFTWTGFAFTLLVIGAYGLYHWHHERHTGEDAANDSVRRADQIVLTQARQKLSEEFENRHKSLLLKLNSRDSGTRDRATEEIKNNIADFRARDNRFLGITVTTAAPQPAAQEYPSYPLRVRWKNPTTKMWEEKSQADLAAMQDWSGQWDITWPAYQTAVTGLKVLPGQMIEFAGQNGNVKPYKDDPTPFPVQGKWPVASVKARMQPGDEYKTEDAWVGAILYQTGQGGPYYDISGRIAPHDIKINPPNPAEVILSLNLVKGDERFAVGTVNLQATIR